MQNGDAENNTTTKTEEWILDGSSTTQRMGVSRLRSPWQFSQEKGVVAADDLVRGGNWCRACSATAFFFQRSNTQCVLRTVRILIFLKGALVEYLMRIADESAPVLLRCTTFSRSQSCVCISFWCGRIFTCWDYFTLTNIHGNKQMSLEHKVLHH